MTAKKKTSKPKTKKRASPKKPEASIMIPVSARGGDVERAGKMSVSWREDPEILQRISLVANLVNANKPSWVIAKTLQVSVATAKRDIKRLREIWAEDSEDEIMSARDESIEHYESIIADAYSNMTKGRISDKAIIGYLNVIIRARGNIDEVRGIVGRNTQINLPNAGAVEFTVNNIVEIRDARWMAVQGNLAKLLTEKQDRIIVVNENEKETDGKQAQPNSAGAS